MFLSLSTSTQPIYTEVTFYRGMGGVGDLFRVETASIWANCKEVKQAQKLFLDKTNELREIAYWDEKGEMHGAGAKNNLLVLKKVNEIFAKSRTSGNPCEVPETQVEKKLEPKTESTSDTFEQIEIGGPEPVSTDPTLH